MNNILLFAIALITTLTAYSLNPSFEWVNQIGGSDFESINAVAIDQNNNIYNTGFFTGTVDFNPGADEEFLTASNSGDLFIQKLDENGNFIWVKQVRSSGNAEGNAITIDNNGDIIITGSFRDETDFDPGVNEFYLYGNGFESIFVLKLDSDGNFIFAKSISSNEGERAMAISTDINNNILITGGFSGEADFDPGPDEFIISPIDDLDVFVLKLDVDGNFVWVKQIGTPNWDEAYAITTDSENNVYTLGSFEGTIDLDPNIGESIFSSNGSWDVFLQKLDSNGEYIWAKKFGGSGYEEGYSVKVDISGNIYTTGFFSETVDFDPDGTNQNLTSFGSTDIFIQKLNSEGSLVWVKQVGSSSTDQGRDLAIDAFGDIYITGWFSGMVDFDPNIGIENITAIGDEDAFVQKLDSDGNLLWVKQFGGSNFDYGESITVDQNNDVITVGNFRTTCNFDIPDSQQNLTAIGIYDTYTHKMSQCLSAIAIDENTACGSFTWIDGTTYADDNNTAIFTIENGSANGCDSVVMLNLTINNVTDLTIIELEEGIIANNANATYQWLDCNENFNALVGEFNQEFMPIESGQYAVELTENGCVDTTACTNLTIVNIDDVIPINLIEVYPNPSEGQFKIDFEKTISQVNITITDIQGRAVQSQLYKNTNSVNFELENPPGIYFISIETSTRKKVLPIIIN